jgi:hypothetical protein
MKVSDQQSYIVITNHTKELLERRVETDYRVHFARYILFEDGIRNDIANSKFNYELRKAMPGDVFKYNLIADYTMIKYIIEQNISNIAKLKAGKQLNNLKGVWLLCYDIDAEESEKEDGHPAVKVYHDPNAGDINNIIKDDRIVLGVFIAIEYSGNNAQDTKGQIEWVMISPGDPNNIEEYNDTLKEMEAETIGDMFYLDFSKKEETPKEKTA